jgi:hypothetical protein
MLILIPVPAKLEMTRYAEGTGRWNERSRQLKPGFSKRALRQALRRGMALLIATSRATNPRRRFRDSRCDRQRLSANAPAAISES